MRQTSLDDITADGVEASNHGESDDTESHRTTVVHCKRSEYDEYIGRGDNFKTILDDVEPFERGWLGNPFTVKKYNRQTAIEKFRDVFNERIESDPEFRSAVGSLQGKTLGCWCRPRDCHGDVIVEYLES